MTTIQTECICPVCGAAHTMEHEYEWTLNDGESHHYVICSDECMACAILPANIDTDRLS